MTIFESTTFKTFAAAAAPPVAMVLPSLASAMAFEPVSAVTEMSFVTSAVLELSTVKLPPAQVEQIVGWKSRFERSMFPTSGCKRLMKSANPCAFTIFVLTTFCTFATALASPVEMSVPSVGASVLDEAASAAGLASVPSAASVPIASEEVGVELGTAMSGVDETSGMVNETSGGVGGTASKPASVSEASVELPSVEFVLSLVTEAFVLLSVWTF